MSSSADPAEYVARPRIVSVIAVEIPADMLDIFPLPITGDAAPRDEVVNLPVFLVLVIGVGGYYDPVFVLGHQIANRKSSDGL